jgi:DNA mismatch endonuclease (patch repair protein)
MPRDEDVLAIVRAPILDPAVSARMRRVRSAHTSPELEVRRLAHRLGYRYRLHVEGLPGKPDLVFPRLHRVIFVNGCFWHRHFGCKRASMPATRQDYWEKKFEATLARDRLAVASLQKAGWLVLTVWECETRQRQNLERILTSFLATPPEES